MRRQIPRSQKNSPNSIREPHIAFDQATDRRSPNSTREQLIGFGLDGGRIYVGRSVIRFLALYAGRALIGDEMSNVAYSDICAVKSA